MAYLIDKDAVVAVIEKLNPPFYPTLAEKMSYQDATKDCIDIIYTIEVKEVDLDFVKEVDAWIKDNGDSNGFFNVQELAKHFFELGLKVKTDKELVEEIYSHIDSIKETADRMTSGNFMHHRAAIKFSANTIAKVLELIGFKEQKGEEYDRQSTENP